MHLERLKDLSIYYWLVDLFDDTSYIAVVDGFPDATMVVPTVAIDYRFIDLEAFELGNTNQLFKRVWYIEIFAINKSQRDDIGYRILSALQSNIPVQNYNEGFPPTVTPTEVCNLKPVRIRLTPVKVMPNLTQKMYYRATVSFEAEIQGIKDPLLLNTLGGIN